jgi:hypothetical protein
VREQLPRAGGFVAKRAGEAGWVDREHEQVVLIREEAVGRVGDLLGVGAVNETFGGEGVRLVRLRRRFPYRSWNQVIDDALGSVLWNRRRAKPLHRPAGTANLHGAIRAQAYTKEIQS